jgi:hypothetical protein
MEKGILAPEHPSGDATGRANAALSVSMNIGRFFMKANYWIRKLRTSCRNWAGSKIVSSPFRAGERGWLGDEVSVTGWTRASADRRAVDAKRTAAEAVSGRRFRSQGKELELGEQGTFALVTLNRRACACTAKRCF